MINKSTLEFLKKLEKNNNREWFKSNKSEYDLANKNIADFADALILELSKHNPALKSLSPKDCLFRIYRDVRFSKNKDPYKTHFGIVLSEGGRKSQSAGFYIQVAAKNSFIAGGCWVPESDNLKKIRQEINYNNKSFKKIVSSKKFRDTFGELKGEKLKTTPKGYDSDNPAIEYLKMKSFVVEYKLKVSDLTKSSVVKECGKIYKSMLPMLNYFNEAMS